MKRLFLPLLALAAPACHKATVEPEPTICIFPDMSSPWRWVSSSGGIAGTTYTPASTGTTLVWQFRADSTVLMTRTKQGVVQPTDTMSYSLGTVNIGQPMRGLKLYRRGRPTQQYVVRRWDTQLVLNDTYADGFTHIYEH